MKLIHETLATLPAPLDQVAAIVLTVAPGPAGPDNAWLLRTGGYVLSGGPEHFTARAPQHSMTVDVDRARRSFAAQGGWWYRGEHLLEADGQATRITHRVYNVANGSRWAVPLANRFFIGFADRIDREFSQSVTELRARLGQ